MSKTVKKLLSVVLAVLVLAAGFSTMLGSFVMAEPEWTYNYDELVPEFDGTNEKFLAELGSGINQNQINTWPAPESFGFSDYFGIATNINAGSVGIRVSDKFFSKTGAVGNYGGEASEVHPYFTYEVEPGTAFAIQYKTYARNMWAGFNLADKAEEYRFLQILVSSDGVNFVPAKFENQETLSGASYDVVNVNIENVGANTKYIKVQFPFDPSVVTQQYNKDTGKWADSYVPQDSFFVQKVKLTARTSTETSISFANTKVTAYKDDGITPKSWTPYMSINGTETTKLSDIFISYPNVTGLENSGLRCFPYNSSNKEDLSQVWGYYADYKRDFFLRVQPGTRFYLSYNDHANHNEAAVSLVQNGIFEKVEDFGWAVYSAENLIDFENGKATKHEIVPTSVPTSDTVVNIKYNFIIPENHSYIRIIDPISGGLDTITFKEGTTKIGYRGNDRVILDHIKYTPFSTTYEKEYNYCTRDGYTFQPGDKATNGVYAYSGFGDGSGQKIGFAPNWETSYMFNVAGKAIRTDDQLMYVTYNVQGGTFFNAVLDVKYGADSIWYKKAYDDNNKDLRDSTSADYGKEYEDFYFEILTSADGEEWNTVATLGRNEDIYIAQSISDSMKYNVGVYVPEGEKFVKILSHYRAGYATGSNNVVYNNTFAVSGAAYNATPAEQAGEVPYNYQATKYGTVYNHYIGTNGSIYVDPNASSKVLWTAEDEGTTKQYPNVTEPALLSGATANATFNAAVGAAAAGNKLQLDYVNDTLNGISIEYDSNRKARGYLIYNVKPGTVFKAKTFMNCADKKKFDDDKVGYLFEFIFSGSATQGGDYEAITNTVTTATTGNSIENINFIVPDNVNFIKVEFPQMGPKTTTNCYGNHSAWLNNVSYVPAKHVEGAQTFNYADATVASVLDDLTQFGAVEASTWNLKLISGAVRYENYNTCMSGDVNKDSCAKAANAWGSVARPYIIYEVKPGTKFFADVYFHSSKDTINNTYLPAMLADGFTTDESKFEFTFEASASKDGGWKNAADTSGLPGNATSIMTYDVPADCKYVKVTFPQRGAIFESTDVHVTISGVDYYKAFAGNDRATIKGVTYVPADADVVVENDYAAKSDKVLGNGTKSEFEIYNYAEVEVTENGIAAMEDAENAFVEYKVSNNEALVIKSDDKLSFEVSYDGEKRVKAQISAYSGAYTVNTIDGKQYVRVYLDAGETITAASAAALAPTATFINAAGKKEVIELDSFGATPAPTLNTARAGYTFSGWDNAVEALYLDATFKADYDKAEETYAITVENGAILKVGKDECPADTTEATARFDDRVVIEAPATYSDGNMDLVFDKWVDAKGNTVSNSHKFSFLASGALALTAKYADAKSDINPEDYIYTNADAIATENGTKWNMSIIWRVNAPADVTITETGVVIAATETTMEVDAANTVKRAHSSTATNKTLMYTITGIDSGATRYARPYAELSDGTVIYGDIVSKNYTVVQ